MKKRIGNRPCVIALDEVDKLDRMNQTPLSCWKKHQKTVEIDPRKDIYCAKSDISRLRLTSEKEREEIRNAFIAGGIVAVIGLYQIAFVHDLKGGFLLLGIGVVVMASISGKFREKLIDFFLSIFKGIWRLVSKG